MALTGKTIGQLTYLSGVTTDTLFPVELSGDTYQLAYSAFTNSNYNTGTYDELHSMATGGTLSAGSFYLMTDYQTCYDQPNFNSVGDPITTGNYKIGQTEPILLLATGPSYFAPTVYSTVYPQDKISYNFYFTQTEVTNSPAKGRITERIDSNNNRTDYDFREVQFIRYQGFYSEDIYPGKISIDGIGQVVSTGDTLFTSQFTVGDILGVYNDSFQGISCFQYYEILTITDNLNMTVTGTSISAVNNTYYSNGQPLPNYMNPCFLARLDTKVYPSLRLKQILESLLKFLQAGKDTIALFSIKQHSQFYFLRFFHTNHNKLFRYIESTFYLL